MTIIKLLDGEVINIIDEVIDYNGYKTCDYGSLYGFEITYVFSNDTKLTVEYADAYNNPLAYSWWFLTAAGYFIKSWYTSFKMDFKIALHVGLLIDS